MDKHPQITAWLKALRLSVQPQTKLTNQLKQSKDNIMTNYQNAKIDLKKVALDAKRFFKNDKPAIRQTINDMSHILFREYDLSDYQCNLLSNYACTLHPKN